MVGDLRIVFEEVDQRSCKRLFDMELHNGWHAFHLAWLRS